MEKTKVSKKYQVVIPEKLRKAAGIRPGDRMLVIMKHGIIQYIPIRAMKESRGFIPGLDIKGLRDEYDRA